MRTTQDISTAQHEEVLESVIAGGAPSVNQASSDFDQRTKTFSTFDEVRFAASQAQGQKPNMPTSTRYPTS